APTGRWKSLCRAARRGNAGMTRARSRRLCAHKHLLCSSAVLALALHAHAAMASTADTPRERPPTCVLVGAATHAARTQAQVTAGREVPRPTPVPVPPAAPAAVTPSAPPQDIRLNTTGRTMSIVVQVKDGETYLGDADAQI